MQLTYLSQPPKRWTFEQPRLKEWVESFCHGKVLNLFAGKVRLCVDEVRVDLSPEYSPDVLMDCRDFLKEWKGDHFDTAILDPPYTIRKGREKYGGRFIGRFREVKDLLLHQLAPGARVITLGWDTVRMGRGRGFQKIAACIICHGGDHNDTLCVVEDMIQSFLGGIHG